MKVFMLLFLFTSFSCFADYVFMRETEGAKTVQLMKSGETVSKTVNESSRNEWALYPDITSSGKEIVYCEGAGQTDLHLTHLNLETGTTQRFFPVIKGMTLHPKFTRNGKLIFFSAPTATGKNTIYYFDRAELVSRQGVNQKDFSLADAKVIDANDEAYFPKPSADGNFVVYQRNVSGKKEIVFFDRLENEKKILTEGMSPSLSFDERLIAFTSKREGNWNVYVYNRESGETKQMTSDAGDEMAPTFMPDNTLVFASSKSGHFRLYKLQGSEWVLLSDEGDSDSYSPQFSGETRFIQEDKASYLGNARSSFGTVSHQGKIYMAGGHQGQEHTYPKESFTDQFIVYDVEKNAWSELAPRPFKAHGYQITAHGNYIYAFGGFTYAEEFNPKWKSLDIIDRYDIRTNKWETIGKLNSPRSSNVAVTIDDKVYLVGGWDSTPKSNGDLEGTFLDTVEVFDLKTEKVVIAPYKLPNPLRRALTGVNYNGKILLVGGLGKGSSHFDLLHHVTAIDPASGEVTELAPLPFATFAPAAEIIKNELFVFGGMFKTGEMNYEYVAHIYGMNLETQAWRHTGRFVKETKGFSQVFKLDEKTLGILGGHHYFEGYDSPVKTFETFR